MAQTLLLPNTTVRCKSVQTPIAHPLQHSLTLIVGIHTGTTPLCKALLDDEHGAATLLLERAGSRCAVNARRSYDGVEGFAIHVAAQSGDAELVRLSCFCSFQIA
jgi:hypothetical protein